MGSWATSMGTRLSVRVPLLCPQPLYRPCKPILLSVYLLIDDPMLFPRIVLLGSLGGSDLPLCLSEQDLIDHLAVRPLHSCPSRAPLPLFLPVDVALDVVVVLSVVVGLSGGYSSGWSGGRLWGGSSGPLGSSLGEVKDEPPGRGPSLVSQLLS